MISAYSRGLSQRWAWSTVGVGMTNSRRCHRWVSARSDWPSVRLARPSVGPPGYRWIAVRYRSMPSDTSTVGRVSVLCGRCGRRVADLHVGNDHADDLWCKHRPGCGSPALTPDEVRAQGLPADYLTRYPASPTVRPGRQVFRCDRCPRVNVPVTWQRLCDRARRAVAHGQTELWLGANL